MLLMMMMMMHQHHFERSSPTTGGVFPVELEAMTLESKEHGWHGEPKVVPAAEDSSRSWKVVWQVRAVVVNHGEPACMRYLYW